MSRVTTLRIGAETGVSHLANEIVRKSGPTTAINPQTTVMAQRRWEDDSLVMLLRLYRSNRSRDKATKNFRLKREEAWHVIVT